ncbi:hypothetical protein L873DRAFT_1785152 [Choiromyces venosus 120613-1]|uniref:Uncharacterized protein n=1 Tax=Choiromyces venosus 120613-1 TaxID=1336337 RepID=A0A3N4K657_9PEZI|nr:hypothetical protein L873DRAFT_1785152 [Choiromyces venosus 120613-1]
MGAPVKIGNATAVAQHRAYVTSWIPSGSLFPVQGENVRLGGIIVEYEFLAALVTVLGFLLLMARAIRGFGARPVVSGNIWTEHLGNAVGALLISLMVWDPLFAYIVYIDRRSISVRFKSRDLTVKPDSAITITSAIGSKVLVPFYQPRGAQLSRRLLLESARLEACKDWRNVQGYVAESALDQKRATAAKFYPEPSLALPWPQKTQLSFGITSWKHGLGNSLSKLIQNKEMLRSWFETDYSAFGVSLDATSHLDTIFKRISEEIIARGVDSAGNTRRGRNEEFVVGADQSGPKLFQALPSLGQSTGKEEAGGGQDAQSEEAMVNNGGKTELMKKKTASSNGATIYPSTDPAGSAADKPDVHTVARMPIMTKRRGNPLNSKSKSKPEPKFKSKSESKFKSRSEPKFKSKSESKFKSKSEPKFESKSGSKSESYYHSLAIQPAQQLQLELPRSLEPSPLHSSARSVQASRPKSSLRLPSLAKARTADGIGMKFNQELHKKQSVDFDILHKFRDVGCDHAGEEICFDGVRNVDDNIDMKESYPEDSAYFDSDVEMTDWCHESQEDVEMGGYVLGLDY